VLCAAQAGTTLVPRLRGRTTRASMHPGAALVPAAVLGAGIAVLRVVPHGPHVLAWLGAIATPLLATLRSPLAPGIWLVAWLTHGLVAAAAAVALVVLAAGAVAELAGRVAPARALAAAVIVLAALDVILVWGTPQVEPASTALHAVRLPHDLPRLQARRSGTRRWAGSTSSRRRSSASWCGTGSVPRRRPAPRPGSGGSSFS
jgi:hypothetical protein